MDKPKLLIADSSEEFRMVLYDALKEHYHIRVCEEGNQTVDELRSFVPDVMVLDLLLPGLGGLGVLQSAESVRPLVLAVTNFINDYIGTFLDLLAVDDVMLKTARIGSVVERLTEMRNRVSGCNAAPRDPRTEVSSMLLAFGVPPKLKGYNYLREAILLKAEDPSRYLTKHIYPEVAHRCGCENANVERSIRTAVEAAWDNGNREYWEKYFPSGSAEEARRPSNAAFIARLADMLSDVHCSDEMYRLKQSV